MLLVYSIVIDPKRIKLILKKDKKFQKNKNSLSAYDSRQGILLHSNQHFQVLPFVLANSHSLLRHELYSILIGHGKIHKRNKIITLWDV